jgi:major type 1 subunit fimbrin (pilin)
MMNKFTTTIAVLGMLLTANTTFAAADGTITINGKIVDQTCALGGTSGNYTFGLPPIAKSKLAAADLTAGDTIITLNLSNCPVGNVGVYLDNTNSNIVNGRLKNTAPVAEAATNVQIQLLNSDNKIINLNKDRTGQNIITKTISTENGSADIDFTARYYSTNATTAGTVSSSITYFVVYQ